MQVAFNKLQISRLWYLSYSIWTHRNNKKNQTRTKTIPVLKRKKMKMRMKLISSLRYSYAICIILGSCRKEESNAYECVSRGIREVQQERRLQSTSDSQESGIEAKNWKTSPVSLHVQCSWWQRKRNRCRSHGREEIQVALQKVIWNLDLVNGLSSKVRMVITSTWLTRENLIASRDSQRTLNPNF